MVIQCCASGLQGTMRQERSRRCRIAKGKVCASYNEFVGPASCGTPLPAGRLHCLINWPRRAARAEPARAARGTRLTAESDMCRSPARVPFTACTYSPTDSWKLGNSLHSTDLQQPRLPTTPLNKQTSRRARLLGKAHATEDHHNNKLFYNKRTTDKHVIWTVARASHHRRFRHRQCVRTRPDAPASSDLDA